MQKKDLLNLVLIFFSWKILIYALSNLSPLLFPLQADFLGGGILNYVRHPLFWGFINFDGEHYLSIARDGYLPLTYFFFPLYPILTKILAEALGNSFFSFGLSGLLISNVTCFVSLVGIFNFGKMFFNSKSVYLSIVLLLIFPSSFFLGSFYNDSLFLCLSVWAFYFAFNKAWFFAFLLCGLASATRLVGLALAVALIYEYIIVQKNRLFQLKTLYFGFLSVIGILIYSLYLKITTGDLLAFIHNIEIFGFQRTSDITLLPQVFYRYFFKILPAINYSFLPQLYTTYLEVITALVFLVTAYYIFIKMKKSLFIYYVLGYLIPTMSGSFSSFPRYALVLFPAFLVFGKYLSEQRSAFRIFVYSLLLLSSLTGVSLYIRGYFVS